MPHLPGVADEEQFSNTKAQPETEMAEVKHHDIKARVAKEDDEVTKQLLKDAEPTWITDQMISRPLTIVMMGFAIMICASLVSLVGDFFAMSESTNRDFLVWDDEKTVEYDMRSLAEEYIKANSGDGSQEKPLRLTKESKWNPVLVYGSKNGESLLEKKNLLKVLQIEQEFKSMPGWTDLCLATSIDDSSCSPTALASSLAFLGAGDISEMPQTQIDQTWKGVTSNLQVFARLAPFYQSLSRVEEDNLQYMRSFVTFGFPIQDGEKRYKDIYDETKEQHQVALDFSQTVIDMLEKYDADPDIEVTLVGQDIMGMMTKEFGQNDMMWAGGAMLYVFVLFCLKLKSVVLGFSGVLIILLSLPFTQFINKGVLQNDFFSTLNTLVIFIILGIGADNIFVFMDGWKQTAAMDQIKNDKRKRLAFAVKRAARATATTSGTTSVAFFANFFSPIMPFRSFGLFATVIIAVNYSFILLIFPPLAVWHEENLEKKNCLGHNSNISSVKKITANSELDEQEELGAAEKFFGGTWNDKVKTYKYPIILVFIVWTVTALIFALQLTPLTEAEEFLPEDHKLMVVSNIMNEEFTTGTFTQTVELYWGIKGINKDEVTMWNADYAGEAIMDFDFDLGSPEAQQSLLDLCEDLPSQDIVLNGDVRCWTTAFNAYLATKSLTMPISNDQEFISELYTWATTTSEGKQAASQNLIGFIGVNLRYMKIQATGAGDPSLPADKKLPMYEAWEEYVANFKAKAPESMQSIGLYGGQTWSFIPTEKAFLSSAFQGMTIAGLFAFIVLLIATGNIVQAFISLICVTVIIIGVLAVMQFNGWEIGVSESIGMVVLIGFSVDYCVHLSADFMHSAHHDRASKMKQAYTEMGVSILSGAITTFGCGCFLFGAILTTMSKFAILITSTIALSFLTSMLLFGALMHAFGPEKGFGDVAKFCNSSKN